MVYTVGAHRLAQRLAMIHDDGTEAFDERREDVGYLQTMGDPLPDGDELGAAKNAQVDPRQALELFQSALGECDVVLDLVNNLMGGKHLLFKLLPGKSSSSVNVMEQMASMATKRMARVGRQRQALTAVSQRLREGAQALRTMAERDNQFHAQVAQLQHYWSIRRAPAAFGPDMPYVVDLTLTGAGAPGGGSGAGASGPGGTASGTAAGGAMRGKGAAAGGAGAAEGSAGMGQGTGAAVSAVLHKAQEALSCVPLVKGPQGQLRLQLPSPDAPPLLLLAPATSAAVQERQGAAADVLQSAMSSPEAAVAQPDGGSLGMGEWRQATQGRPAPGSEPADVHVGLQRVHDALLQCQQSLLWALLLDVLEGEAAVVAGGSGGSNWTKRLVTLVAELLATSTSGPTGAVLSADGYHSSTHSPPSQQLADPLINSLRPVMLEHVLSSRLGPAHVHTPRHLPPPPATLHRLLPDVAGVVSHVMSRSGLWNAISHQVVFHPHVSLHWVPTTRLCSSAVRVRVGAVEGCLIVLQDTSVDIDGVLCGHHGGTRWGGEGHTAVSRNELPVLLSQVCLGGSSR